jgi:hypothetical protein
MAMQWSKGFGDAAGQVQEGLLRALDIRKSDDQLERQRKRDELTEAQARLGMRATEQQMTEGADTHQFNASRRPLTRFADAASAEKVLREQMLSAPEQARTLYSRFNETMGYTPSGVSLDASGQLVRSPEELRAEEKAKLGLTRDQQVVGETEAIHQALGGLPEDQRAYGWMAKGGIKREDVDPVWARQQRQFTTDEQIRAGKAVASHSAGLRNAAEDAERTRPYSFKEEAQLTAMGLDEVRDTAKLNFNAAQQALRAALSTAGATAKFNDDYSADITYGPQRELAEGAYTTYLGRRDAIARSEILRTKALYERLAADPQTSPAGKKAAAEEIQRLNSSLSEIGTAAPAGGASDAVKIGG